MLGQNSEVAVFQEIAAAVKNDLTLNLMANFAVLVSRIMKDNELFCSLLSVIQPNYT